MLLLSFQSYYQSFKNALQLKQRMKIFLKCAFIYTSVMIIVFVIVKT